MSSWAQSLPALDVFPEGETGPNSSFIFTCAARSRSGNRGMELGRESRQLLRLLGCNEIVCEGCPAPISGGRVRPLLEVVHVARPADDFQRRSLRIRRHGDRGCSRRGDRVLAAEDARPGVIREPTSRPLPERVLPLTSTMRSGRRRPRSRRSRAVSHVAPGSSLAALPGASCRFRCFSLPTSSGRPGLVS